jgi:hypothetical protein
LREKIMPKRFTDTNTWHQTWFLELSPESKIIWTYLKDNCDCAGIWKIDLPAMKREIGFKNISLATFLSEVNRDYDTKTGDQLTRNRVMIISNENKLWMTGFITFQYEKGTNGVNANIPAIKGVLNRIREEKIYEYAVENGFLRIAGEDNSNKNEDEGKTEQRTIDTIGVERIVGNSNDEGISDKGKDSSLVLINDINNNPRGCRPFTGDKDKDKDLDQEVLIFKDVNKEAEEESNVHKEPDKGGLLLERTWNKWKILPEERRLVNEYISKYGIDAVDFAFREGVKYNKMNLAYVDAICRKRKEKSDLAEYRKRDKMKLRESILKSEEQKRNGQCLKLISDVYDENGRRKAVGIG